MIYYLQYHVVILAIFYAMQDICKEGKTNVLVFMIIIKI